MNNQAYEDYMSASSKQAKEASPLLDDSFLTAAQAEALQGNLTPLVCLMHEQSQHGINWKAARCAELLLDILNAKNQEAHYRVPVSQAYYLLGQYRESLQEYWAAELYYQRAKELGHSLADTALSKLASFASLDKTERSDILD